MNRSKKKQLIIVGIIVLLVSAGLTLLTYNPFNNEKNKFIGTWKSGVDTMDLSANGACNINISKGELEWPSRGHGKWALKNNLFVTFINGLLGPETTGYYYKFTNNDMTLLLTKTIGGSTQVFIKQ